MTQDYTHISLGLIGCGAWGKNLARNFKALGVLRAVADASPARTQEFSELFNVPTLSAPELVKSAEIQAVIIATTAEEHFTLAKAALLSGKDVYVEKPLTLTNPEALELCKIAREQNAILMVGHILKYHPSFQALLKQIQDGAIGDILYIQSVRHGLGRIRRKEDVLWDFAPHDLAMILEIAGESPLSVSAEGGAALVQNYATIASLNLEFPSGLKASVSTSWVSPIKEQRLVVTGTKGVIVFDDRKSWEEKVILFKNHVLWNEDMPHTNFECEGIAIPHPQAEPLKAECQHFLDAILSREIPHTPGEEGLLITTILEVAQEALLTQKAIFMDDAPQPQKLRAI
ncbi:Gfo/Idh/MocA family oxidoreductase [Candidatus Bealeia paramacronuclearis]|uniref:Gfo/Idh/MocA family protein n=1 Tax=Candidatus Bealeia paramacronuclearis TaxID=1921001 RepID=UPI0030D50BD7